MGEVAAGAAGVEGVLLEAGQAEGGDVHFYLEEEEPQMELWVLLPPLGRFLRVERPLLPLLLLRPGCDA